MSTKLIGEPFTPVEYCRCGRRQTLWYSKDKQRLWFICGTCGIPIEQCNCKPRIVRKNKETITR